MYTQIFTGNLTDMAVFQNIDEEKSVVNFTVAVNFLTSKKNEDGSYKTEAVFFLCSKWIKGKEKPKWVDSLVKGKKVMVESNYFKITSSEKEGHTYQNFKVYVNKLEFVGNKTEDHSIDS